jgi:uncharacterized membrane protein YraQ (UPF0718 family)
MWTALIGPIADLASGYLNNKKEKAVAQQKLEVAKIEAQVTKVQTDANWEESAIKASDNSWKDELWTVFFVLLIGACFVPAAQPYISDGFKFLREDCPEWLSWGILASIAASFGLKSIGQFKK